MFKKQNSSVSWKLKFSFDEFNLFLCGVQLVCGISVNVCQVMVDYEAIESLMGGQCAEYLFGGGTWVQVAVRQEVDSWPQHWTDRFPVSYCLSCRLVTLKMLGQGIGKGKWENWEGGHTLFESCCFPDSANVMNVSDGETRASTAWPKSCAVVVRPGVALWTVPIDSRVMKTRWMLRWPETAWKISQNSTNLVCFCKEALVSLAFLGFYVVWVMGIFFYL